MSVYLSDDGTLDTVFTCETCGEEIRYSGEGIERDEDGSVPQSELDRVASEHADECEGPEVTPELLAWIEEKRAQTGRINRESGSSVDNRYGTLVGRSRDSGILERSNWRTIVKDMRERFPDEEDVFEGSFGHWAVGWIEELFVRLVDEGGQVTLAGHAAFEWAQKLEAYPIADEEDHSELELESEAESWDSWGEREFEKAIRERFALSDEVDLWGEGTSWDLARTLMERTNDYPEHDDDGASFPIASWVESMTGEEGAAFESALPPYKRDSAMPEGWGRN